MPDITPSPLIAGKPRQFAYVTTDIDRALTAFAAIGAARFTAAAESEIPVGDERTARFKVALAYVGDIQLEVIEPIDGADEVYRSLFSDDGYQLRFHHVAYWPDTQEQFHALKASAHHAGFDPVLEGSGPFGSYFYIDARETLGHFVEYFAYAPGAIDSLREVIPAN